MVRKQFFIGAVLFVYMLLEKFSKQRYNWDKEGGREMDKNTVKKKFNLSAIIFVIIIVLLIGLFLAYVLLRPEKSGVGDIYFGTPGFVLELKEGRPDSKEHLEYGVVRTYEDEYYFGRNCDVSYLNVLGVQEITLQYENADKELYQEIFEKLRGTYQNREHFFEEEEKVEGNDYSISFGTNNGAEGITVDITLEADVLTVRCINLK